MAARTLTKRPRSACNSTFVPETLDRQSSVPFFLQIEEAIRARIESGTYVPSQRVQSEVELSHQFGVSRMTARKALDRLVAEGVLFRRPGKGTFVAIPRLAHPASSLTSFSAAVTASGRRVTTRVLRAGLEQSVPRVTRQLGIAPGELVVHVSRLRMVDDEPVAIHTTDLSQRFAGLLSRDLAQSLTTAMEAEGAGVVSSRDTLEAIRANTETAHMLGVPPGAPLMRMESTGFSSNGDPVRVTEAVYRGDRVRFTMDVRSSGDLRVEVADDR